MMLTAKNAMRLLLCAILITVIALTAHIYILKWNMSILQRLMEGKEFLSPENYSFWIVFWAYVTAFEQMCVITAIYYYAGGLLPGNKFIKVVLLCFILLELSGNLIRMTVMNAIVSYASGVQHPIGYGLISQSDKIMSAFLISVILVLFCPTRIQNTLS